MTATTLNAKNHDDQLGEIYPTMLTDLNCTFGICLRNRLPVGGVCVYVLQLFFCFFVFFFRPPKL